MAPGPLLFLRVIANSTPTHSKEDGMKKSKKVGGTPGMMCAKKHTARLKKLGKRASKTIAVKG